MPPFRVPRSASAFGSLATGKTSFVPARDAARKLGRTPAMRAMLSTYVEAGEEAVKAIAPVGDSKPGDHYKDQIEGVVGTRGSRGGVFIGRINAFKWTSHWIEFGTINNPAYAPLRRGLAAIGARVFERKKKAKA